MNTLDLERLVQDAEACVRCGLCLSVCPTYRDTQLEIQSPRGRVMLYAAHAQDQVDDPLAVLEAAYDCLDCRACQTVCPNDVKPGEAALDARVTLQQGRPPSRLVRAALALFHYPFLIDLANVLLVAYQRLGLQALVRRTRLLERLGLGKLQFAESLLPGRPVHPAMRLFHPRRVHPDGKPKGKVAFFLGCVMNLVFSEASKATVEVIRRSGWEVVIPRETTCCGAPHIEEGDWYGFERLAKQNLDHYGRLEVDYILTDCAACGAELKGYAKHFAADPVYGPLAERVAAKTRMFSEFVNAEGLPGSTRFPFATTHQHACHACHAQGVKDEPERVLRFATDYRPLEGSTDCCGSAGVYNLTHTDASMRILERKMAGVADTGAEVLTVENPGCLLQLDLGARRYGPEVRVRHIAEVVLEAMNAQEEPPR
ncbi:(Fe-S)-binding protein [Oceanithermus desulfurans]|uniref:Glycolate oxidase iron-sulfur subunit n=2 Tax=Oceanithermus desulfurans TaxID=227924 RepID=A0A511RGY9_9DEIN|nr:(Fe-S)-binding protein [Oceanithermus desulfurans]MBB6028882.1 glycolate oxidase iron-sulfur subunit [Oceanithermus desulfurans]GEM88941.1 glycolate oxidase iron-sulfur subunit [Oceanithermus desulfurans NBRC 100063]